MTMRASLPTTMYLLSYDEQRKKVLERSKLGYILRGAGLTELALRAQLADEDGTAKITDPARTGDAVLDALVAEIAADKQRKWKVWVRRQHTQTLRLIEEDLQARRVIGIEQSSVLGVFKKKAITADTAQVQRLRAVADEVLRGQRPVAQIDPLDAAVVSLAAAGAMRLVVSSKDSKAYKARIAELSERSGAAVPALRKVLADIQAAMIGAVTAAAVSSTSAGN